MRVPLKWINRLKCFGGIQMDLSNQGNTFTGNCEINWNSPWTGQSKGVKWQFIEYNQVMHKSGNIRVETLGVPETESQRRNKKVNNYRNILETLSAANWMIVIVLITGVSLIWKHVHWTLSSLVFKLAFLGVLFSFDHWFSFFLH